MDKDEPTPSLEDFIPFAFGLSPSTTSTPPSSKRQYFANRHSRGSPYSNNFRGHSNKFSPCRPNNSPFRRNKSDGLQNEYINHSDHSRNSNNSQRAKSFSNYNNSSSFTDVYSDRSSNMSSSSFSSCNTSWFADDQVHSGDYSQYLHPSFTEDPWEPLRRQRDLQKTNIQE